MGDALLDALVPEMRRQQETPLSVLEHAHAVVDVFRSAGWIAKSDLVEQACAGAVVGYLPVVRPVSCVPRVSVLDQGCEPGPGDGGCDDWVDVRGWYGQVPTASVGPFVELAGDVARKLLDPTAWQTGDPTCDDCDESPPCRMSDDEIAAQRAQDGTGICDDFAWREPLFAAAYADINVKGGRWREYVLVSAGCGECGGAGVVEAPHAGLGVVDFEARCPSCGGTGAEVNTKAIAARYSNGPETAGNTARKARFRVRVG